MPHHGKRGGQGGEKGMPAAARAGGEMAIAARAGIPPERDPTRRASPWDQQAVPVAAASPASTPLAAFQEDDRRWFADHPGRHHRVRPFDPAEAPPGHPAPARPRGWRNFTVIRQVKPGQRIRVVFAAEGEPSTGEHAAARLFEICLRSLGGKPG